MKEPKKNYKYNKALFLDRDGVINNDYGHVHKIDNFHFKNGIFELCKKAISKNFLIIIVTNQAGIGKKMYTKEDFLILNDWIIKKFREKDIKITETFYCPHTDLDNCICRKPKPGMILKALEKYRIDPKKSIMIGNKNSDILACKNSNLNKCILFQEEKDEQISDLLFEIK